MNWNGAYILAFFAWASWFVEAWMMLTGRVANGVMEWFMWGVFLLIGTLSSAYAARK